MGTSTQCTTVQSKKESNHIGLHSRCIMGYVPNGLFGITKKKKMHSVGCKICLILNQDI